MPNDVFGACADSEGPYQTTNVRSYKVTAYGKIDPNKKHDGNMPNSLRGMCAQR